MRVYVINKRKDALMPTTPQKAKKLLKSGNAKVVKRTPFTIQLMHPTGETKQDIILGIDAGSSKVGVSAVSDKKELYSEESIIRNDIVKLLSTRREFRRARRNRKTRYRKPRFLNRVKTKNKGWLAPSIEHKINSHLGIVRQIHQILPITKIIVETASFDIQKIKNPEIKKEEYQQGDQLGFWNIREYVLFRDGHKCQACKGKSKDKILEVHHIESRKTGGDSPGNLITLCSNCHNSYHKGTLKQTFTRTKSFKEASFMGIMRWAFFNRLKNQYSDVSNTYGYITKNLRINNDLKKEHRIDARCITGIPSASSLPIWYSTKFVRKNNRSLHKATILKGGYRKANKAPYLVKGFRLFDKVNYKNQDCFIFGRRISGSFDIRLLDNTKIHAGISYKHLRLIEYAKTKLIERRTSVSSST